MTPARSTTPPTSSLLAGTVLVPISIPEIPEAALRVVGDAIAAHHQCDGGALLIRSIAGT